MRSGRSQGTQSQREHAAQDGLVLRELRTRQLRENVDDVGEGVDTVDRGLWSVVVEGKRVASVDDDGARSGQECSLRAAFRC